MPAINREFLNIFLDERQPGILDAFRFFIAYFLNRIQLAKIKKIYAR